MLKKMCCLIIILQLLSLNLYAQEDDSDQNALRKLARGAANISFGWTEIVHQTILVKEEGGDFRGLFYGPLKGLAYALRRTLVGIFEVITFTIAPAEPLVEPEFIFE